ncbi:MAG: 50S ribosomal protein L35ae [archaeon]
MEGKIVNYRRGRRTQYNNQYLIEVIGKDKDKYKTKQETISLFGKKVIYKTATNKLINGKIVDCHGSKGIVRAIFEKGLPGTAIGQTIEIK